MLQFINLVLAARPPSCAWPPSGASRQMTEWGWSRCLQRWWSRTIASADARFMSFIVALALLLFQLLTVGWQLLDISTCPSTSSSNQKRTTTPRPTQNGSMTSHLRIKKRVSYRGLQWGPNNNFWSPRTILCLGLNEVIKEICLCQKVEKTKSFDSILLSQVLLLSRPGSYWPFYDSF